MAYVHVSTSPDMHLADYERVRGHLGPEPIEGQQRHLVGEADGALHIVDVWDSRAAADRFAAERLFPAFEAAGVRPNKDTRIVAFEVESADV